MRGRGGQLPLDLRHRPATGREDFLVSPSNEEAAAWIDRWPGWPGPALVLAGPAGSGKTHLAQAWRARAGALEIAAGGAPDVAALGDGACVLADDADAAGDDAGLLHLHDAVAARGGHLLVAARTPPARWSGRLPDLVSRLAAAPVAEIRPPDEALVSAVLVKMLADRRLDVGADALAFALARIERSFEAARILADEVGRASLAARRRVTLPLVREVIEERQRREAGASISST